MPAKKKVPTIPTIPIIGIPKTILCPIHGQKISVQRIGDHMVANCTCNVPNNKWLNQPVWDAPIS